MRHVGFKRDADSKVAYLIKVLEGFEEVVILNGHEKFCRRVCHHQGGEHELHPTTSFNILLKCSQWPDKTTSSSYCREHETSRSAARSRTFGREP